MCKYREKKIYNIQRNAGEYGEIQTKLQLSLIFEQVVVSRKYYWSWQRMEWDVNWIQNANKLFPGTQPTLRYSRDTTKTIFWKCVLRLRVLLYPMSLSNVSYIPVILYVKVRIECSTNTRILYVFLQSTISDGTQWLWILSTYLRFLCVMLDRGNILKYLNIL